MKKSSHIIASCVSDFSFGDYLAGSLTVSAASWAYDGEEPDDR